MGADHQVFVGKPAREGADVPEDEVAGHTTPISSSIPSPDDLRQARRLGWGAGYSPGTGCIREPTASEHSPVPWHSAGSKGIRSDPHECRRARSSQTIKPPAKRGITSLPLFNWRALDA